MLLHRLLSWIRGRGSTLSPDEPGAVISTRLKELLPVKNPSTVETARPDPQSEEDENRTKREKFGT
jgi:hypothetical protein